MIHNEAEESSTAARILEVLAEAEKKFPHIFDADDHSEQSVLEDAPMCEFVALNLEGVWWYNASKNCHFVCTVNNHFYDVDYMTKEITEISEEEYNDIYEVI